ncbi:phospholipase A [Sphingobium sp. WTD-1]|uniref:phospholipase A n=1 Tax=Sphingobium sp. WTD-1 TaxID=2979467 RepID=UPI0024DE2AB1|nr:phospholipase A [Sphingobium sp. WTD-1]WIA57901.1 phospholipase A [Sphingobium sp. WTD-1]
MIDRLFARACRARAHLLLIAGTALCPTMLRAQAPVETLIGRVGATDAQGMAAIELRFLNMGTAPAAMPLPDRVEAQVEQDGAARRLWLRRAPGVPETVEIASGGFAQARYQLAASDMAEGALLSIPAWNSPQVALHGPAGSQMAAASPVPVPPAPAPGTPVPPPVAPPADRSAGNAFIGNLAPYEPIYAVYGPGTNTDARLQLSFEYRLFGSRDAAHLPSSWRDGLHFAYTQRMFWDLGANSMPFRNIDYQPEIIYVTPTRMLKNGMSLALQGGLRHESNGRDGDASRSINSVYVAPMAAFSLGEERRLLVAPRLTFYVGDKSDNPDIVRYRGHAGLFLQVGDDDGLRLSTNSRFNFGSGKGAINADLSYPLPRLLGGGPDLYLFAQGFAGYGENLLDYNRSITRLRIGFALVR